MNADTALLRNLTWLLLLPQRDMATLFDYRRFSGTGGRTLRMREFRRQGARKDRSRTLARQAHLHELALSFACAKPPQQKNDAQCVFPDGISSARGR